MTYLTPAAFRAALTARLKAESRSSGRSFNLLRRSFVIERFTALLFTAGSETRWTLKGGAALLFRLDEPRFSKDVDVAFSEGCKAALDALAAATEVPFDRHIQFRLGAVKSMSGAVDGVEIPVAAYIGATVFDNFPIDLSLNLSPPPADEVTVTALVELPDLTPLPKFRLYPLADHVADKICAMYETHGSLPSTRFRDLGDLLLIAASQPVDFRSARAGLARESARRNLVLPATLSSPDPLWTSGFNRWAADEPTVPPALIRLDAALRHLSPFADPLLSGDDRNATWDPAVAQWADTTGR